MGCCEGAGCAGAVSAGGGGMKTGDWRGWDRFEGVVEWMSSSEGGRFTVPELGGGGDEDWFRDVGV